MTSEMMSCGRFSLPFPLTGRKVVNERDHNKVWDDMKIKSRGECMDSNKNGGLEHATFLRLLHVGRLRDGEPYLNLASTVAPGVSF